MSGLRPGCRRGGGALFSWWDSISMAQVRSVADVFPCGCRQTQCNGPGNLGRVISVVEAGLDVDHPAVTIDHPGDPIVGLSEPGHLGPQPVTHGVILFSIDSNVCSIYGGGVSRRPNSRRGVAEAQLFGALQRAISLWRAGDGDALAVQQAELVGLAAAVTEHGGDPGGVMDDVWCREVNADLPGRVCRSVVFG